MGKIFSRLFYTEIKTEKKCIICKKDIETFAVKEISKGNCTYWCSYECYKRRKYT